jgi:DMSO/TMAO reductase YedYZ molybdopterin-dependent catalytic subunit
MTARRSDDALAGAVAAGLALGVSELVCAAAGRPPSLVSAVATRFVDRFAGPLKELAVELFGANDKTALVVGIVTISLGLGALAGLAARRRPWVPAALFGGFAAVGAWSYASHPEGSWGVGGLAAVLGAASGLGALWFLLRLQAPAQPPAAEPTSVPRPRAGAGTRRTFLVAAVTVGGAAAASAVVGRRLRSNEVVEAVRRRTTIPRPVRATPVPAAQPFMVEGLSPYVTPTKDFYRIDTAITLPRVDVSSWSLKVKGMVDRPYSLSYEELLGFDAVEEAVTLTCVSNEIGDDLVGNAVWQGVPLSVLLERAGVRSGAEQLVGRSVDRFTAGFPVGLATDGRAALVAYAMNGEPLPIRHGFPARLVVSGLYGYVSATKWLSEIELTTWDDVEGYWVPKGWAREAPVKTMSRIDVPRHLGRVTPGPTTVAGVAWAPSRGIVAVEVSVDDGPWQPAVLGRVASEHTWVQWRWPWNATPGDHVLRVRATDGDGVVQTGERRDVLPDGATGWHHVRVLAEA